MTIEIGGRPMDNLELYPVEDRRILGVINKIRGVGGESYAARGKSELARRNPVKEDTAPLLTYLAHEQEPVTILELGTAYGYSGLHFLLGSPLGRLVTVEYEDEVAKQAQATFDEAGVDATVLTGDATDILAGWTEPIDLFFVDHDKKQYLQHFKAVESYLTPGALIVADNVNDRRSECEDFVKYIFENYKGVRIYPTLAGLLVVKTPYAK